MTLDAFRASLGAASPPTELSPPLAALWWTEKDEWDRAHELVQDAEGPQAAWVHAYLHRARGDLGNAAYWYREAGQPVAQGALDAEWTAIAVALSNRERSAEVRRSDVA